MRFSFEKKEIDCPNIQLKLYTSKGQSLVISDLPTVVIHDDVNGFATKL